jgi:hypothetical protein
VITESEDQPAVAESVEATTQPPRAPILVSGHAERVVVSLIVGVGIALRVLQYLANRSLWADEVAVAVNLRLRSLVGLLHPLSYDQTMPVGLLVFLKATGRAFGFSEFALRLPLLLAGCALLILTWVLFSRIFEQRVVLLMLALMGISEALVSYSSELKQYGVDALVTVLMVWLGVTMLNSVADEGWPWLIAGGGCAMLFSQPIVFVLASIGVAAVLDHRFQTSPTWRRYAVLAGFVWVLLFSVLLWFSYRASIQDPFMRVFWTPKFIHVGSPSFRGDLLTAVGLLLGDTQIARIPQLALGCLFLMGVYTIVKKQGGPVAVIAGGPFALLLLAAALKQYPIVVRLVLFSLPLMFWIYASGIAALADFAPRKFTNVAFVVLSGILLFPTALRAAWGARHVNQREGTRDIVKQVESAKDLAPVYLVFGRYMQWEYYGGDWNHPEFVQQRIDAAAGCLRAAQLGYAYGSDERLSSCVNLDFPSTGSRPEEVDGNPPPGSTSGMAADDRWAAAEAARIAGLKSPSVWLFLPDAAAHFISGFPLRRKLLDRLETDLKSDGCREVENYQKGETLAHKFECRRDSTPIPTAAAKVSRKNLGTKKF